MPLFELITNVKQVPANFVAELTDLVAQIFGKPKEYVFVRVVPDQLMALGGTPKPCGEIRVTYLGSINAPNVHKDLTKAFYPFIKEKLNIPQDRLIMVFHDLPLQHIALDGRTFDEVFDAHGKPK